MSNAAARMMSLGNPPENAQPASSIFGSAAGLASSIERGVRFRLAVYPIICDSMPDVSMGIASCLCYLIEQYHDISVYRCFAKIEIDDDSDEISSDDYQFSPAQWEMDGLDDNLVLQGQLSDSDGDLELTLLLDKSLADGEGAVTLPFRASSLAELVNDLPTIARELAEAILERPPRQLILAYTPLSNDAKLTESLELVFGWNLDLYLNLWDVEWAEDDIQSQYRELIEICHSRGDAFAYWCLGMAAGQLLQFGVEDKGEAILPLLEVAVIGESCRKYGAAAIAAGLSRVGHTDRSLRLLETFLQDESDASLWNAAIDLYLDAGRQLDAIDACQTALENGVEHPALYWRYVELLRLAEANELSVPDVLLIDPGEAEDDEDIAWEAIGALDQILRLDPRDADALLHVISQLIELEDEVVWEYFERLIKLDPVAPYVSEVIEQFVDMDDLGPLHEILKAALDDDNRPFLYGSLAQVALLEQNYKLAADYVAEARGSFHAHNDELELELQRLELMSAMPDFEARFAEVKLLLNAGRPVSESDADLLESAIETAPKLVDTYITLARVYASWRDYDGATEILLEGREGAGEHPRIILGLAQVFWNTGRRDVAIEELNAGIASYANDIALLTQMASYLIENGQLDDARRYMERAESIAPSNRAVTQMRGLIARKLAD